MGSAMCAIRTFVTRTMFSMTFSRGRMIIQAMLALIDKLYDIERETKQNGLDAPVVKELRQQPSAALLRSAATKKSEGILATW